MQAELSIVKLFLDKEVWTTYNHYLDGNDFPEELKLLYRTLDSFHKINEESLHLLDLANLFFSKHPKDKEYYEGVFDTLATYEPNKATVIELIQSIKNKKILREISIKSYEAAEGKASLDAVLKLLQTLEPPEVEAVEDEFITDNLDSLLKDIYVAPGLRWRLESLNKHLGSLRKGDFGFVFARPETGKTTFLASEVSYMAEQVEKPVIWFNNEEGGKKVKARVYQGSLGLPLAQLMASPEKFQEEFLVKTKGCFKLKDKAGIHKNEIESICKRLKPSLVVFDQIDKIMGFDADREDLRLGAIYIWARNLAKQFCPIIAVCQSDGSGEGQRWLTMANVANAKTSKQAEADWILGIGAIPEPGYENIRFFHLSKNKLTGDPDTVSENRHGKWQVLIKPDIARYQDI